MNKLISELYEELDIIFRKYTTHQWKNGWQNEGDRESDSLSIVRQVMNNNLFLLTKDNYGVELRGNSFRIEAKIDNPFDMEQKVRFDIKSSKVDHICYLITEEDWQSHKKFIVDFCGRMYESEVKTKEIMDSFPIIGREIPIITNPRELYLSYIRTESLDELLDK